MLNPGDVVVVDVVKIRETKHRPAIVVSTEVYHKYKPDIIIGILTTQMEKSKSPTDYLLTDWKSAGLNQPSAFRAFLYTYPGRDTKRIGKLIPADWTAVQERLRISIDTGTL